MEIKFCLFRNTTPGNCEMTEEVESTGNSIPKEDEIVVLKGKRYKVSSIEWPDILYVNLFPEEEEQEG